jgi:glycerophosphoryl diester phosphodiesterase
MKPLVIAHRGASGYAPENTILAFQKAIDLAADMIEFDVRQNREGIPIVIHDKSLRRTTNGRGLIKKRTLAELRMLDAGQGQTIPTLEEAINFIGEKAGINIEIKEEGLEKKILEIIENSKISIDGVIISSKRPKILALIKGLAPDIKTALIFRRKPPRDWIELVLKLHVYAIHPRKNVLNPVLVNQAHRQGLKVNVYLVDKPKDIERAKKLSVDGIFTGFPDRIRS